MSHFRSPVTTMRNKFFPLPRGIFCKATPGGGSCSQPASWRRDERGHSLPPHLALGQDAAHSKSAPPPDAASHGMA